MAIAPVFLLPVSTQTAVTSPHTSHVSLTPTRPWNDPSSTPSPSPPNPNPNHIPLIPSNPPPSSPPSTPTSPRKSTSPCKTVFAPDRPAYPRFVNRFNPREILLAVDGSCLNNGRHASKSTPPLAACAFLFKVVPSHHLNQPPTPVALPFAGDNESQGAVAFRLERRGPAGDAVEHTSNRAKLRAVVAVLQFRPWGAEGWRRVVVLTDLEYLVLGATRWVGRWVGRGWVKPGSGGRGYYANRDLWEVLVERMEELRDRGCEVSFLVG